MRKLSKIWFICLVVFCIIILPVVIAPGLTILSPTNKAFNETKILFNLKTQNKSTFYYAKDSDRWIKLCSDATNCEKYLRAKEGQNSFTIKAIDRHDNINITTVSFFVDSKIPEINKIGPKVNEFTNGAGFYVVYKEENKVNITLFYGIPWKIKNMSKTDCPFGKKQECIFNIDSSNLAEFDSNKIWFWFVISDGLNSIESEKSDVNIDTISPSIKKFEKISDPNDEKKVKFIFEIIEKNFDKITYIDNANCGSKYDGEKILCKRLTDNRCVVTKNFCEGTHKITFNILDKAGNSATQTTEFII